MLVYFCCTQLSVQSRVASLLIARFLVEGMEPSFCAQLQTAGIHADIIAFLGNDKNRVYSITRFANFIDQRSEIQSHILNHVAACKDDRGQRATLCELWREADIAEQHRLENKAKGLSQNDFEEPLPIGALDGYLDKFEAFYHYRPFLTEILAEPLVGRLKREIDRKTFTVLPLGRVRNNKESTKQAMGKRLPLTTNMALFLRRGPGSHQRAAGRRQPPRRVPLQSSLGGGLGHRRKLRAHRRQPIRQPPGVQDPRPGVCGSGHALWKATPPLVKVLAADEDTRALYAASLQKGLSLDLAIKTNEGKKAALWLWACGDEAAKAKTSANSNPRNVWHDPLAYGR